jgi:hypothetical protein
MSADARNDDGRPSGCDARPCDEGALTDVGGETALSSSTPCSSSSSSSSPSVVVREVLAEEDTNAGAGEAPQRRDAEIPVPMIVVAGRTPLAPVDD